eukprot:CAMPEP_0197029614 /NCGR_PEP_ID=MMETSP1384-20130603/9023_1 /TAXON_ID=29189 /ORGANISM="Ammonia sp." /LENGTH=513 /DNA_ID=CAMNT_0042458817 /DNA_START=32 /DNA_END=1573 /DNA_ORIENTATION=+
MSSMFNAYGLVSSAVTVYGVYKLGKTAYEINNTPHPTPTENKAHFEFPKKGDGYKQVEESMETEYEGERVDYMYFKEETISDKIIFVPKQYTERAIAEDYILEQFESKRQLFYYLRRRANMEAIHGNLRVYQFTEHRNSWNMQDILIFCTDLHCTNFATKLYVVGTPNDKEISSKSMMNLHGYGGKNKVLEKWKMSEYFMTAGEIRAKYGILGKDLPTGSAAKLTELTKDDKLINTLVHTKNHIPAQSYSDLKPIKTKFGDYGHHKTRDYSIPRNRLLAAIRKSNTFRPIISFCDDKRTYYIDMVCMVQLEQDNWIGIIFRDYKGDHKKYIPIDMAIDCYDIRNKIILFQPPMDRKQYRDIYKYQNNISNLYVLHDDYDYDYDDDYDVHDNEIGSTSNGDSSTPHTLTPGISIYDDQQQRIRELEHKLLALESDVKEQKVTIQKQAQMIEMLKEQNNHYFQQCLDPNSNIRPHSVHAHASTLPPIQVYMDNNNHISNIYPMATNTPMSFPTNI